MALIPLCVLPALFAVVSGGAASKKSRAFPAAALATACSSLALAVAMAAWTDRRSSSGTRRATPNCKRRWTKSATRIMGITIFSAPITWRSPRIRRKWWR